MGRMSRLNAAHPKPKLNACCECGKSGPSAGVLIRWMEPPTQFVCIACCWELGYPEYCYDSCAKRD